VGEFIQRRDDWLGPGRRRPVTPKPEDGAATDYDQCAAVLFVPVRCPRCKSDNLKCYGNKLPIRYHDCKDCGCRFKSVEKTSDEVVQPG
jgi:predicted Zn-ribbon and HTH transcriptional regulator